MTIYWSFFYLLNNSKILSKSGAAAHSICLSLSILTGVTTVRIITAFWERNFLTFWLNRPDVAPGHKCGTINATDCGLDPHSTKWNIYLNLYSHFFALVLRQSAALSATQRGQPINTQCHQNSAENGEHCLNTRFLLCAGNSVKLIFINK